MNSLTVFLLVLLASPTFGGFVPIMHPGLMKYRLMKHGLMKHGLMKHGLMKQGLMKHGLMKQGLMKHGLMNAGLHAGYMNAGFMNHGDLGHLGNLGYIGNLGHLENLGHITALLLLSNRLNSISNLLENDPLSDRFDSAVRSGPSGSGGRTSVGAGQNPGQTGFVNAATNSLPQF